MSAVSKEIVAIACSDIHLSHTRPRCRGEKDWYATMWKYLKQLRELQAEHNYCYIIFAGDLFDRWNAGPELINFAIKNLPRKMVCIPGQHDIPYHDVSSIHKSAYWTLVETEIIKHYNTFRLKCGLRFTFFPYGEKITPPAGSIRGDTTKDICVTHQFLWMDEHGYPGAPSTSHISAKEEEFSEYDLVISGDNHKGFHHKKFFNCGGFMRRKSNENEYHPRVGLITKEGEIIPHFLDVKEDVIYANDQIQVEEDLELNEFIDSLNKLEKCSLDFKEAIHQVIEKQHVPEQVRRILLGAMDG